MPDNGKITLSEAAKAVGVHYNTLRNWRKAGWLKSAEKVIQSGNETWIVSLEEVASIARQRAMTPDYNPPQTASTPAPATDTPMPDNSPAGPIVAAADVQTLANLLETTVKSLTEALERRDQDIKQVQSENKELHRQIGTLEERLRLLEQAPTKTPQNTPKKRWWQR
jgi:phage shock protein A